MDKRELPFDCMVGTEDEVVTNIYSGETCTLPPDAVAVFDTIKGAEITGNHSLMGKGLAWFSDHFPTEYMILLD